MPFKQGTWFPSDSSGSVGFDDLRFPLDAVCTAQNRNGNSHKSLLSRFTKQVLHEEQNRELRLIIQIC